MKHLIQIQVGLVRHMTNYNGCNIACQDQLGNSLTNYESTRHKPVGRNHNALRRAKNRVACQSTVVSVLDCAPVSSVRGRHAGASANRRAALCPAPPTIELTSRLSTATSARPQTSPILGKNRAAPILIG